MTVTLNPHPKTKSTTYLFTIVFFTGFIFNYFFPYICFVFAFTHYPYGLKLG